MISWVGSIDCVCNFNCLWHRAALSCQTDLSLRRDPRHCWHRPDAFLAALPALELVSSLLASSRQMLSAPTCHHGGVDTSTAPCTLHLGCSSLAGGGGNRCIASCTGGRPWQWLLLAMVVFGGVARAPLVPPTGLAGLAPTFKATLGPPLPRLADFPPAGNASAARLSSFSAGVPQKREGWPACRECRGGRVARAAVGPARPIVGSPHHSPDPPHQQKRVPIRAHLGR